MHFGFGGNNWLRWDSLGGTKSLLRPPWDKLLLLHAAETAGAAGQRGSGVQPGDPAGR